MPNSATRLASSWRKFRAPWSLVSSSFVYLFKAPMLLLVTNTELSNIPYFLGRGTLTVHLFVENKPKKELIRMLQQMGYDSDPVKAWKLAQEKVAS